MKTIFKEFTADSFLYRVLIRLIFLVALVMQTWTAYGFFRRAPFHLYFDVLGYFMETKGSDSLWDGLRLVDYAKARTYWKGDDVLFRPLLFVWLAIQNSLFSYHYQMWNLVQMGVFIGVLWILFEILLKTGPPLFAGFWVLFFVSSPASNGLLRNVHLGGYLLGTGCFLWAFLAISSNWLKTKSFSKRALLIWVGAMTSASFFYEIYVFFGLCIAVTFACFGIRNWKVFAALILPALIYGAVYSWRMPDYYQMGYMESVPHNSFFTREALENTVSNAIWTFRHLSGNITHFRRWFRLGAGLVCLWAVWPAISRLWLSKVAPLLVSLLISILIYCLLIGWMRGGFYREYYDFPFAILTLLFLYLGVEWKKIQGVRKVATCILLTVLIAWNSVGVQKRLENFIIYEKSFYDYFEKLESLVDQHRQESDFSFRIDRPDEELDHGHEMRVGYADTPEPYPIKRTSEIMYAKYYRVENPKYLFSWEQNHWQVFDSQMTEIQ